MNIPAASVIIPARNPPPVLGEVFSALAAQELADGEVLEVILVDDGSTPPIRLADDSLSVLAVRTVRREQSSGRAAARNAGAAEARGDCLLFLDCDCVPQSPGWAAAHIRALQQGAAATAGVVQGDGSGFWDTYQRDSSLRRARQQRDGAPAGSTQNLGVRRQAFETIGGFDVGYAGYGFEDRDLLARVAELGPLTWIEDAVVSHRDVIRLDMVTLKMAEAGRTTAPLFRQRHPQAYRTLGYAAIDATLRPWLQPIARALGPLALGIAPRIDPLLDRTWVPYPLGRTLVKTVCALSFLYGTSCRNSEA